MRRPRLHRATAARMRSRSARRTRARSASANSVAEPGAAPPTRTPPTPIRRPARAPSVRSRRARQCVARSWLSPGDQVFQSPQFFFVEDVVFENVEHQRFMRIAEEPAHQVADLEAGGVALSDRRFINVRAAVLHVLDVSLLFE